MDDLTPNKIHIPPQSWVGQNGWSTTSAQGPSLNTLPSSQPLIVGSSSDQRSLYNHLQMPNQSCMRELSTNNSHHSTMYKDSQSSSLFANTALPNVSQMNPFAQEIPHSSPMLLSANQETGIPPLSLAHRNQAQQQLPLFPPQPPYKVSFRPPVTGQGLTSGLQNLPINTSSCRQPVSTCQDTYEGVYVEFAGVAECTHSHASSTPQEQSQWIPSLPCKEAVSQPIPETATLPDSDQSGDGNINAPASGDRQRLALLNERAKLLQQLAELDKALESLPTKNNSDSCSPNTANESTSMEDSSHWEKTTTGDGQQVQPSAEKLEIKVCPSAESEPDSDPDDPVSDDDFSEFIPDPAGFSSDDSRHSRPSSPMDEKPAVTEQQSDKPESPEFKTEGSSPLKIAQVFSLRKSSKTVVSNKHLGRKKNYCLFCSKPNSKMARHFEAIHSDRPEVAVAFQYPCKSKERLKIWNRLINQGNFAHNKTVLKTGMGQLAAKKRPKSAGEAKDYLHCLYCQGLFKLVCLRRHMRTCPERVKSENGNELNERKRIAWLCVMEASDDICLPDGLKEIVSVMVYDEVTRTIMDDKVILQLGEMLYSQHGSNERRHEYIRQNLRQISRLVLEAQKTNALMKLEDFFTPANFPNVVSLVKVLAGYNSEKKTYKIPSLAIKLGYNIQKACGIVEANAVKSGDERAAESARQFLSVYQEKWTKQISSCALKALRKSKSKNNKKVPSAEDVKKLNSHLEKVQKDEEKKFRECRSAANYFALANVVLARTIIFNRRSAREVSFVELKAFMDRKKSDSVTRMDISVSDMERAMCGLFTRIDIRGKCGRTVPIFLNPSILSALELLVDSRETCGVSKKNPFLFARIHSLRAYHGSQCLQRFVKTCGAKNPEALCSKNIIQHHADMLQMMNLDEKETKQILDLKNKVRAMRQDGSMQPNDVPVASDARSHQAANWDHNHHSSFPHGSSMFIPQTHGLSTSSCQQTQGQMSRASTTTQKQSVHPEKKASRGKNLQVHRPWEEAEVRAVERYLMRFIRDHKVPGKDDCVECLEAEPEALSTRTWKGVKDYVRNRITALKRQNKSSKA